jgi:micrococcal nuclease
MTKNQGLLLAIALTLLFTSIALATSSPTSSSVILYAFDQNPAGLDEGNEWVTIHNPSNENVDIGNWTFESTHGTTAIDWIPEGTTLYPGAYFTCTPFYRWMDNSEEAIIYGIKRVRLIGVHTPEIGEEGYEEAKEFVNGTCLGEALKLDVDDKKQYDPHYRILAVVYVNDTNLNEKLVREGYAEVMYIPPSEFDPDTLNTIIATATILFALLGGFITQYLLTRNEKIIGHMSADYQHLRDTLYLFNSEQLYENPDKSKKILGPIFDYLAWVCQLWYIPAVQGGYLRKAVLEAYQADDLKEELKEHFLDTAKKFEESRGGVRAFPSGLFGFVLVILILLAGISLVGLWIRLIYLTSFNLLFFVFYLALSIFFVLFFFFIYDLKRLDAFFAIPRINHLLKWLFFRCLIFASTDKNEKTTENYTKNVSEYLEKAKSAYDKYTNDNCIDNVTREESLDKAVEIAEQFLKKRKKIAYLFTWDKVPGDGEKKLKQFLKDDFKIKWANDADISKSYDDKTIHIYEDEHHEDKNSAKIMIVEANKKAILAISDGETHELKEYELKVKWEDGKLNIHNRAKDWEKEVEWTAPKAATEVVLREWWFKWAYVVFGLLFFVVLISPGFRCVFSCFQLLLCLPLWGPSEITCIVYLWVVIGFSVVLLLCLPFNFSIGEKENPSFLKNLPSCWDKIIEQHNEEKVMQKAGKREEEIYTEVKKEIENCMKPGKEKRWELFKKGIIYGIILVIIFGFIRLFIGGLVYSAATAIGMFITVIILVVIFIIGTFIGDILEVAIKK